MTSARRYFYLLLVGMILSAASLACGLGAAAPVQSAAPVRSQQTEITQMNTPVAELSTPTAEEFPLIIGGQPTSAPTVAPQPAIPESRRLTLEYPPNIRVGDSDVIRLTLEVDTLGNITPTAEVQGNILSGKIVQIPNVYDTHNVFAEARFDVAGPNVRAAGCSKRVSDSRSACNILLECSADKRGNISRNGLVLFAFRG